MRSALCALMPAGAGLPGVEELGVDAFLVRLQRDSGARLWAGMVAGSIVFALFPLFTIGVPLPASLLSARLRERYVQRLVRHPLYLVRQSVFILKMAAGMCWGESEVVRKALALPPYPPDPGTWRSA